MFLYIITRSGLLTPDEIHNTLFCNVVKPEGKIVDVCTYPMTLHFCGYRTRYLVVLWSYLPRYYLVGYCMKEKYISLS